MEQFLVADCNRKSEILNTANNEKTERYFHYLDSNSSVGQDYYEYLKQNHNSSLEFGGHYYHMPTLDSDWVLEVSNQNKKLRLKITELDPPETVQIYGSEAAGAILPQLARYIRDTRILSKFEGYLMRHWNECTSYTTFCFLNDRFLRTLLIRAPYTNKSCTSPSVFDPTKKSLSLLNQRGIVVSWNSRWLKSEGFIEFFVYRSDLTERFVLELETEQIKTTLLQIEADGYARPLPTGYMLMEDAKLKYLSRFSMFEGPDYWTLLGLKVFKREKPIFARIETNHLTIMELLGHLLNMAKQQGIPKLTSGAEDRSPIREATRAS